MHRNRHCQALADAVKALSEKLEIINLQFARRKAMRRSLLHWLFVRLAPMVLIAAIAGIFITGKSDRK